MYNLIMNDLGNTSFVYLNKAIINDLGLHEAVVLGFFADRWAYFKRTDFYYTIQDLSNDTGLSKRKCRNIIHKLVDKGILIDKGVKHVLSLDGAPPKQLYNINKDALIKYEGAIYKDKEV